MPTFRPRPAAAGLAALITAVTVCAGDAAARSFPFGPHTRSVSDLGNQFVPFHIRLWDLLHGNADGGLFLNWSSGYGTSFLPDLGTYLTSPFALLVGVFPRDRIDLAVYVVTVLKMASAAAAMAFLLLTLRGGRPWVAGVFGSAYALCGWSVAEAAYNPMWLDGLIALPLLCLAGEWARTGRRRVVAPLLVAVVWAANFYTAYMATLGAALVLVVRLLTVGEKGTRVRGLVRAARTVLLGAGLAAPVLLPVYLGTRHAYPGWDRTFRPAAWPDVLARLLPGTYDFFTPALFLGTVALLPACVLAFQTAVPRRERWAWAGLVAGVALSMQWGPTHLLWHAFATPNGSPYRQTFVLAGLLVVAAWLSVSYGRPGRRALFAGCAVLMLIAAGAAASDLVSHWTYPLFAAGLVATAAALVLLGRGRCALLAAALLIGALAGQAAATTAFADRQRLARLDDYAPWGERQRVQASAVAGADAWPRYRTDPGREQTTANDPLLVGGQGAAYYSSHTPAVLTRTLGALGAGWTSNGRAVQSLDNPVTDAIFAVGARVRGPRDPHQRWDAPPDDRPVTVLREVVPPLVTVRGPGPAPSFGRSPFRNQEVLLGSRVYTVPRTVIRAVNGAPVEDRGAYSHRVGRGTYLLSARCPAGSEAYVWTPGVFGSARLGEGREILLRGMLPSRRAAMERIGPVAGAAVAGGTVRVVVTLRSVRPGTVPREPLGCLDRDRLAAAVAGLRRTGATSVHVGDRAIRAELPPGSRGTVVVAAPRIAGWRCAGRPADAYLGLVAVPVPARGSAVQCTFRPPGLRAGSAVGTGALLVMAGTGAARAVLLRRRPRLALAGPG
ncbi:YfhO family protein [Streptomyces sp. NBC_01669]|uniref:YfhO family protein n=1 Tax=Streptomyces sp. NBC_01669 TaxID=2975909 RepID=UPI00224F596E|nr:YfhO family protein [Streptomyces sp. NBC_01669]MCX4534648.1 YfhO family protein [Streptomyces sp. NBC_01669]